MDNVFLKIGTSLLIGSDGATGSIIVEEFRRWNTGKIFAPTIQKLDYRNALQIEFFLARHQPDCIFLVGAYTNVDKAEYEDRSICWNINRDGIEHFLQTMLHLQQTKIYKKTPKIIYISTDMVGSGDKLLSENENVWSSPENPKNEYGKSKLAGEIALKTLHKKNKKAFQYHIVRIAVPFSGLRKGSFLTLLCDYFKNSKNSDNIRLVADQYITPTFAEDLAWNLILIAKYGNKEVYHDAICDEKHLSVYDIGMQFAKICEWNVSKIGKMSFREMYDKKFWSAPRGISNELEVKNLLTLPSPLKPKIHTMKEVLTLFYKKYRV